MNLDLMCGLLGETAEQWRETVRQAIQLKPDAVTVYQTEIPHNTRLGREYEAGTLPALPVSWDIKRVRLAEGMRALEEAGYSAISAYNMVRDPARHQFLYQDSLWRGADMLGLGVASFGYVNGVHYQNLTKLGEYQAEVARGGLPVQRAFQLSTNDRLVREFALQLKFGSVALEPFRQRFGTNALESLAAPLKRLASSGWLTQSENSVELTRAGLLRVDRLLPCFFDTRFQSIRYS